MEGNESASLMELFAEHEEAIGRLYSVYAGKLPDQAGFWPALATDERQHAAIARELARRVAAQGASFQRGRFRAEAARGSLAFVEEEIAKAQAGGISLLVALSVALDLERGLIEKQFFETFDGDSEDVVAVLHALERGTAEHRGVLQHEWEKARRGGG